MFFFILITNYKYAVIPSPWIGSIYQWPQVDELIFYLWLLILFWGEDHVYSFHFFYFYFPFYKKNYQGTTAEMYVVATKAPFYLLFITFKYYEFTSILFLFLESMKIHIKYWSAHRRNEKSRRVCRWIQVNPANYLKMSSVTNKFNLFVLFFERKKLIST